MLGIKDVAFDEDVGGVGGAFQCLQRQLQPVLAGACEQRLGTLRQCSREPKAAFLTVRLQLERQASAVVLYGSADDAGYLVHKIGFHRREVSRSATVDAERAVGPIEIRYGSAYAAQDAMLDKKWGRPAATLAPEVPDHYC